MSAKKLRVGITGAGVFGGYHAAKMVAHEMVYFVGIYDPVHPERAVEMAQRYGAKVVQSRDELVDFADALIIASPASAHGHQGLDALQSGLHVLVEKPMATDMNTAREMVAAAAKNHLVLQVGHQERFVSEAIGLFAIPEKPVRITTRRVCPFQNRGTDVSVTLDLMIHDLETVTRLMGVLPQSTRANTRIGPSGGIDETEMFLSYAHDVQIALYASRMADAPARTMELCYPSGTIHVDFLAKTLIHDTPFTLNTEFGKTPMAADCLGASDYAFVAAALGRGPSVIDGLDGARALSLALQGDQVAVRQDNIAV